MRELPEFPARFAGHVVARNTHSLTTVRNYSTSYQVRVTCARIQSNALSDYEHRLSPASNKS